ncbi:unnamed protein product, partial [Brenthis ino]
MTEHTEKKEPKIKLLRCMEWLQNQNDPEKLSSPNKNDEQFIIEFETKAQRKNVVPAVADDIATVPAGIDEPAIEPKAVPLRLLRKENLLMECEWQACKCYFNDYQVFQKHVAKHVSDLHVTEVNGSVQYVCLWDVCGHSTNDFPEMVRHINYHAYHAKLLAIGFNGRATLKLERCQKDSSKRNMLPALIADHCCMWVGCTESFNSIQMFFDHVQHHINYSEDFLCSWAGCGAVFHRRVLLTMHVRSHTRERVIACFHCGHHFACNRKLSDHLLRQTVSGVGGVHACSLCGLASATAALRREHERQHVSAYACALCDMSAPSRTALAHHVRYRHLAGDTRTHKCPHCAYKAVTKWDLRKHIPTHTRKKKLKLKQERKESTSDIEISDEEEVKEEKKKKVGKKYACHMCPEKEVKVFSRGTRLTTHLVKVHGAQWPFGHSRFRYQISEDGMYRLTTTRFEFEDVSKKIVDGYSWPKESLTNKFEFDLKQIAEATETSPKRFEITLKKNEVKKENDVNTAVEIMMCDVDEHGNIISTETITDVIYS